VIVIRSSLDSPTASTLARSVKKFESRKSCTLAQLRFGPLGQVGHLFLVRVGLFRPHMSTPVPQQALGSEASR
jgi:hypothetical protein